MSQGPMQSLAMSLYLWLCADVVENDLDSVSLHGNFEAPPSADLSFPTLIFYKALAGPSRVTSKASCCVSRESARAVAWWKLILALVNGFVIAALAIELLFESWSAFVLILIVLRIGNVLAGEIRSGKRRQNLPRHRSRACITPFVHGPLGTGHERSGRHRTMRLQELNAFFFLPISRFRAKGASA
jgi:hypothetical protein